MYGNAPQCTTVNHLFIAVQLVEKKKTTSVFWRLWASLTPHTILCKILYHDLRFYAFEVVDLSGECSHYYYQSRFTRGIHISSSSDYFYYSCFLFDKPKQEHCTESPALVSCDLRRTAEREYGSEITTSWSLQHKASSERDKVITFTMLSVLLLLIKGVKWKGSESSILK